VVNELDDNITVLFGDGDGTFSGSTDYDVGDRPLCVHSGDIDGDSDVDLVTADFNDDSITVLYNDGTAVFDSTYRFGAGNGPISLWVADYDDSDSVDVAVANYSDYNILVLLNQGDGTLAGDTTYATGTKPYALLGGDLDADADIDLLVANYSSNNVGWLKNTTTLVVSADDEAGEVLPSQYSLEQNYPNPFNPTTTINYSVPEQADVEITVYNLIGQRVNTLVDEEKAAGNYSATWDGKDDNGKPVSSGVYFYRLKAGNVSETRKMMLLK
jgi:hypothetical protein